MAKKRGSSINNQLLGTAIVTVAEPTIDAFLDKLGGTVNLGVKIDVKDIGKAALGYYLNKKSGMIKGAGQALMIIGIRNVIRNALGSKIGNGSASNDGW